MDRYSLVEYERNPAQFNPISWIAERDAGIPFPDFLRTLTVHRRIFVKLLSISM